MLKRHLHIGSALYLLIVLTFFYCDLALPSNPMENPDNLNVGISIVEPASGIIVQDQPVTFLLDVLLPKHATAITVKFGKDPKDTSFSVASKTPVDNDSFFVKCSYPVPQTDTVKVTVTLTTGSLRVFTKIVTVTPKQLGVSFVTTPVEHNAKVNYPDTMKFAAATSPAGGAIFFSVKSDPVLDPSLLSISSFGNDAVVIFKADSAKIYTITCTAQSGTAYDSAKVKVTGYHPSKTPVWKQDSTGVNAVEGAMAVVSLIPFLNDTTLSGTTLTTDKGTIKDNEWSMFVPWGTQALENIAITAKRNDSLSVFKLGVQIISGDSVAPTIKLVNPNSDTVTVNKKEFTCAFLFADSSGISNLSFKLGGKILADTMSNANTIQCRITGLSHGKTDTLTVAAIDGSMKKNVASIQLRITCDTTVTDITPAIKVSPQGVTVVEGATATFSVEASGTNLVYQWKKNDASITNANTANYSISATTLSDNGNYYKCVVSNSSGTVISDSAKLTVSPKVGVPKITVDPKSISVIEGASATFTVEADATSVQYQWQRDSGDITGEIGVSYKLASAAMADNNAMFRCIVSNGAGKDTSESAALTVLPKPAAPVISTVIPGDANVIVSWGAINGATSYTLYYKEGTTVDSSVTTKVSGAVLTQTVAGLTNGKAYAFAVNAANENGKSSLSEIRTAAPQVPVAGAPTLSAPTPGSGKVTLSWTSITGAVSYNVYYQSGTVTTIDKAIATKTAVAAVATTDISSLTNCQTYTFGISTVNAAGESSIGTLQSATPVNAAPTIATSPDPIKTACEGTRVEIPVIAAPAGTTLTYQWSKGTHVITTAENSSADKATLVIESAVVGDAGTYSCSIKNGCSSAIPSGNCVLTINRKSVAPTVITANPTTICLGGTSTLSITGGSLGTDATWKWYTNAGFSSPATVTAVVADGSQVKVSSAGSYYVRAEGGTCGNVGLATGVTVGITPFTITASTVGNGGSITPSGAQTVLCGNNQTFAITPDAGYHVASVLVDGSDAVALTSYNFQNVTTSHTIIVTFAINTYTLNVTSYPVGGGTVARLPYFGNYNSGAQVSLTATPAAGYQFSSWSGDASGIINPFSLTMNANKNVTANFIQTFTVTFNSLGGSPVTSKVVVAGAAAGTLPTQPNKPSYVFDSWKTQNEISTFDANTIVAGDITVYAKWVIKDTCGNIYTEVKIGTQTWMVQDLKTIKFNDGIDIPNITDNDQWAALSSPAYCWHGNVPSTVYGLLYNWAAAHSSKLAPKGWHVPTNTEWMDLFTFTGSPAIAGKLKETGLEHWATPNTGATNASGFTALPGGFRYSDGNFMGKGFSGNWWGSTQVDIENGWCQTIGSNSADVAGGTSGNKIYGFSVRCIKDPN